jgi:hypothetical protein
MAPCPGEILGGGLLFFMPEKNETPTGREDCKGFVQHSRVLGFPASVKKYQSRCRYASVSLSGDS